MRYEVAAETNLAFYRREGFAQPINNLPQPETVVIEFEGRRFVWHANEPDANGTNYMPTVTTMVADPNDYRVDRGAMERFLSALAYSTGTPIEAFTSGGAGGRQEMDRPFVRQPREGLATFLHSAPAEVVMEDDDRLRVALAHYRDGLNTTSPFFRFLGFWNALDVACEDYQGRLPQWVSDSAAPYWHRRGGDDPAPPDIWDYLRGSSRNAVAHAIPHDVPALDPDDPDDRARLASDARLIRMLTEVRIRERWGNFAIWLRPQQ
jgi:hypothetical protein